MGADVETEQIDIDSEIEITDYQLRMENSVTMIDRVYTVREKK